MFAELHILQSFPPSCLNRDDTGTPKDCTFGGVRRARISSQCLKRSIRWSEPFQRELEGNLGIRTKRLREYVLKALGTTSDDEDTCLAIEKALHAMGLALESKNPDLTQYLLYIGEKTVADLASLIKEHKDHLVEVARASKNTANKSASGDSADKAESKKTRGRGPKKDAASDIDAEVLKRAKGLLRSATREADVALFGRMLADRADANIDAACQVAHAISTHQVQAEFDFFTAVDDLNPKEDTGAGMMGTVEHQSACYYRYQLLTYRQLVRNLDNDRDLARQTARAFVNAAVQAIPSGKQNTFAALTPPALVLLSLRDSGMPRSFAGAFEEPVRPGKAGGVVAGSINRLAAHRKALNDFYGNDAATDLCIVLQSNGLELDDLATVKTNGKGSALDALLDQFDVRLQAWNEKLA